MKVSEFMVTDVLCCRPEDKVKDAAILMRDNDFSVIPVVDENKCLKGVITAKDFVGQTVNIPHALADIKRILGVLHYFGDVESVYKKAEHKTLNEVMNKMPFTVSPDVSLTYIIRMMHVKNVKRIPVIDKCKLVGIVTREDLITAFIKHTS